MLGRMQAPEPRLLLTPLFASTERRRGLLAKKLKLAAPAGRVQADRHDQGFGALWQTDELGFPKS